MTKITIETDSGQKLVLELSGENALKAPQPVHCTSSGSGPIEAGHIPYRPSVSSGSDEEDD